MAQILAEEKQRSDNIAEGLEEESKKSLRMEEELEKQAAASEQERKIIKANLAKEELRYDYKGIYKMKIIHTLINIVIESKNWNRNSLL